MCRRTGLGPRHFQKTRAHPSLLTTIEFLHACHSVGRGGANAVFLRPEWTLRASLAPTRRAKICRSRPLERFSFASTSTLQTCRTHTAPRTCSHEHIHGCKCGTGTHTLFSLPESIYFLRTFSRGSFLPLLYNFSCIGCAGGPRICSTQAQ